MDALICAASDDSLSGIVLMSHAMRLLHQEISQFPSSFLGFVLKTPRPRPESMHR